MIDAKTFGHELAEIVKGQLAPILSRMDALEKRLNDLPAPRDGKDADLSEVRQIIADEVASLKGAIEAIEPVSLPDIPAMVVEEVEKAVSALPAPKDGKSVTVEEVAPLIASEVEKQVQALPKAKDGEPGKDGVGLAGALIDRGGELIVTLTNGETKRLGPVVGKDGEPGEPGKDGTDGLGFDDLDAIHDGQRGFTFRFAKGERVKEFAFSLPVVLDCGVFKEGQTYQAGDGVTWGGSYWVAQDETAEKPDSGKGWRLAVKRGRDGKDGVLKAERPKEPIKVG